MISVKNVKEIEMSFFFNTSENETSIKSTEKDVLFSFGSFTLSVVSDFIQVNSFSENVKARLFNLSFNNSRLTLVDAKDPFTVILDISCGVIEELKIHEGSCSWNPSGILSARPFHYDLVVRKLVIDLCSPLTVDAVSVDIDYDYGEVKFCGSGRTLTISSGGEYGSVEEAKVGDSPIQEITVSFDFESHVVVKDKNGDTIYRYNDSCIIGSVDMEMS